ncbi:MAG: sorbosone dehydrogenase family protein, partial [Acidimicrobiales bacterium]
VDPEDPTKIEPHPDNPFYNTAAGDDALFAYGLRNPFRFSIDPETDALWLGDVGQQCVEEIDVLTADDAGANFGWNVFEGNRPFLGDIEGEHRKPDFTYERADGKCAVIGGLVYRGGQLGEAEGYYLFGDLCESRVLALAKDFSSAWETDARISRLVSLRTAPNGRLFGVSIEGTIYEVLLGS